MKEDIMRKIVADTNAVLRHKARVMSVETNCEYVGVERVNKFYTNRDNSKISNVVDYELFPLEQSDIEEFSSNPNRFIIDCKKIGI